MRHALRQAAAAARRRARSSLPRFGAAGEPLVWLLAPLLGLAAGVGAVLFRLAIGVVQLPWLGDMSEQVVEGAGRLPWWLVLLAPAAGGLVVGLMLQHLLADRRAGSVPDVIEARLDFGRHLGLRQGLASAAASAVSLGSGVSAGREGPVVHLGASLAAAACARLSLSDPARRTLIGCGVAGAVSASFNAPIAGVLFAQEVILGQFAVSTFAPLVLASVAATIVSRAWFGDVAAFTVPDYHVASYLEVPAFVILGAVAAIVAVAFQAALLGADRMARGVPMPLWLRPAAGGLVVGAIAVFLPEVLGVGYDVTDAALAGGLPLHLMVVLIVAKTAATAATLASRFGGGIFSTALYLGAMTGGAFGLVLARAFPEAGLSEGLYALLGMGAVAAAVLGAPISTAVMVFELTGGYALAMALLLTVAVATGLSLAALGRSYFHAQLEIRGVVLPDDPYAAAMQEIRVADFMEPPADGETRALDLRAHPKVLCPADTLGAALRALDRSGAGRLAVVSPTDHTRLLGWAGQEQARARLRHALAAGRRMAAGDGRRRRFGGKP